MGTYYTKEQVLNGQIPFSGVDNFLPAIETTRLWISRAPTLIAAVLYGSASRNRNRPQLFTLADDLDVLVISDHREHVVGQTEIEEWIVRTKHEVRARHHVSLSIELVDLEALMACPDFRRGPGYVDHLRLVCSKADPEFFGLFSPIRYLELAGCFRPRSKKEIKDEVLMYLELQQTSLSDLHEPEHVRQYCRAMHRVIDAPVHIARRVGFLLDAEGELLQRDDRAVVSKVYAQVATESLKTLYDDLSEAKRMYVARIASLYTQDHPGRWRLTYTPEMTGTMYQAIGREVVSERLPALRQFIRENRRLVCEA